MKGIEREIADRIKNPLEEGTPLFQRVFERVSDRRSRFYGVEGGGCYFV